MDNIDISEVLNNIDFPQSQYPELNNISDTSDENILSNLQYRYPSPIIKNNIEELSKIYLPDDPIVISSSSPEQKFASIEPALMSTKTVEIRQPEIRQPEIRQPEVRQPEIRQPEVRQPEIRQPQPVRQPEIRQPQPVRQPEIRQPQSVRQPEVRQPEVRQPEVRQPEVRQPEVRQPEIRQPEIKQQHPVRQQIRDTQRHSEQIENNSNDNSRIKSIIKGQETNNTCEQDTDKTYTTSNNTKTSKKVRIFVNDTELVSDVTANNEKPKTDEPVINTINSNIISFFGCRISYSTIYFIIVMILIGVALYFLTSDGKKKKKDAENTDDDNNGN
jgi:hypothetical protein